MTIGWDYFEVKDIPFLIDQAFTQFANVLDEEDSKDFEKYLMKQPIDIITFQLPEIYSKSIAVLAHDAQASKMKDSTKRTDLYNEIQINQGFYNKW